MKWLFDLLGITATPSANALDEAIEHVVDGIDPRLRLVPGYRRLLQPSLQKTLAHIDDTVDRIHGPLGLDRKAYFNEPEVKALFASPDELDNLLRDSSEITSFLHKTQQTTAQEAWALLCVSKEEKNILGMQLSGNAIRRDVPQTAINFYDHKLMVPSDNEDSVRSGMKKCIFDGIITYALQHIIGLKAQRRELEDQRRILHARLRARQSMGNGLTSLLATAQNTAAPISDIESDLHKTEELLQQLPASANVLGAYLEEIRQILNHPEEFIQMDTGCFRLSNIGIKVDTDSTDTANTVCYSELEIAQVLKRVVAIVHFPCNLTNSNESIR